MSKLESHASAADLMIDERFGECQCCKSERVLSSAGYCEPCLILAHEAASNPSAMIALKLRATWR
jgi:hypothetical protein